MVAPKKMEKQNPARLVILLYRLEGYYKIIYNLYKKLGWYLFWSAFAADWGRPVAQWIP